MNFNLTSGWAGIILSLICIGGSIGASQAVFSWRMDYYGTRIKELENIAQVHNDIIIRNQEKLDNIYAILIRIEGKLDCTVTEDLCDERCARIYERIDGVRYNVEP